MSIQIQIQAINQRSTRLELALFGALALTALTLIALGRYIIGGFVIAAYIPLSIRLQNWLTQWREARILEVYRYAHEPVFEIQYDADDRFVHLRAKEHRRRLAESGNEIYKRGLITVEEVYFKDVRFGYAETPEELTQKREDFIKDFMNTWAKSLNDQHHNFILKWCYGQEIDEAVEVTQTPSVQPTANDDFWTVQFPMLSKILRGKEEVTT